MKALVEVQAAIAEMSCDDRMLVGQMLADEFRRSSQLSYFGMTMRHDRQYCEINTDALAIEIEATPPEDLTIEQAAMGIRDEDLPF